MQPTQAQLNELAKIYQIGTTGDEEDWESEAIAVEALPKDYIVVTRDTLDDFRHASKHEWNETSTVQEINGGLFWPHVQARKGDRRESLSVCDCGEFRIAFKM